MNETSFFNLARRPFLDGLANIRKFLEDRSTQNPCKWQRAHPLQPPCEEVVVRFIIPLISRTKANNWQVVCRNLEHTIESLRRQTNESWCATIACQTRPDGIEWDNKVRFMHFPIAPNRTGNDKQRKQRYLIRKASQMDRKDGYLFFLDADDLLHPRLVQHIVTDNNGHGYTITQGYMVDLARRRLVPLNVDGVRNGEGGAPFFKVCGSSSAIRFDLRQNKAHAEVAFRRGPHGRLNENMAKYGLKLEPVPFPAGLYVFDHGDNLQRHRGADSGKRRSLETLASDLGAFNRTMREFEVPVCAYRESAMSGDFAKPT